MQVEHDELIQAISAVLSQHATQDTCDAVTTKELCASLQRSEEYVRHLIDEAIQRNEIRYVRVWRATNAGYRTRVPGWQLCQSDNNS